MWFALISSDLLCFYGRNTINGRCFFSIINNAEHGIRTGTLNATGDDIKGAWKATPQRFIKQYLRSAEPQADIPTTEPSWLISNGYAMREFNGLASEVDRIAAIGNGQIPGVVAAAWRILNGD